MRLVSIDSRESLGSPSLSYARTFFIGYPIVTISFLSLFVSLPKPPSLQVTSMPVPLLSSFSKALAKHSINFDPIELAIVI